MITIYVDSDACPIKDEVMRVARRHKLKVIFVANTWMRLSPEWDAQLVVVDDQFDAADNWIVEHVSKEDVVVTADIPLADRSIKAGARVIEPQGRILSADNIGSILATRNLMHELRSSGEVTGGPAPFQKEDRSNFLQELEKLIQQINHST